MAKPAYAGPKPLAEALSELRLARGEARSSTEKACAPIPSAVTSGSPPRPAAGSA